MNLTTNKRSYIKFIKDYEYFLNKVCCMRVSLIWKFLKDNITNEEIKYIFRDLYNDFDFSLPMSDLEDNKLIELPIRFFYIVEEVKDSVEEE